MAADAALPEVHPVALQARDASPSFTVRKAYEQRYSRAHPEEAARSHRQLEGQIRTREAGNLKILNSWPRNPLLARTGRALVHLRRRSLRAGRLQLRREPGGLRQSILLLHWLPSPPLHVGLLLLLLRWGRKACEPRLPHWEAAWKLQWR